MDRAYSVEFFSSFVDAVQKLCRDFLDFDQAVELSGYLSLEIDNSKKERYVLSELVQNSGGVISESYCTKAFRTVGWLQKPSGGGDNENTPKRNRNRKDAAGRKTTSSPNNNVVEIQDDLISKNKPACEQFSPKSASPLSQQEVTVENNSSRQKRPTSQTTSVLQGSAGLLQANQSLSYTSDTSISTNPRVQIGSRCLDQSPNITDIKEKCVFNPTTSNSYFSRESSWQPENTSSSSPSSSSSVLNSRDSGLTWPRFIRNRGSHPDTLSSSMKERIHFPIETSTKTMQGPVIGDQVYNTVHSNSSPERQQPMEDDRPGLPAETIRLPVKEESCDDDFMIITPVLQDEVLHSEHGDNTLRYNDANEGQYPSYTETSGSGTNNVLVASTCRTSGDDSSSTGGSSRSSANQFQINGMVEICPVCGKMFAGKESLARHSQKHQRSTSMSPLPASFPQDQKKIENDNNQYRYTTTSVKTSPIHQNLTKGDLFKCLTCHKAFAQQVHLKEHMQVHVTEDLRCSKCHKSFKETRSFHQHFAKCESSKGIFKSPAASKDPSKTFECPTCGKGFSEMKYLKQHEQKHMAENYECRMCGKAFKFKSGLSRHQNKCLETHDYMPFNISSMFDTTSVLS